MKKYILKRVLISLFTLLVILFVLFVLMQLMPGSPFNDEKLNDSQRAQLYAKYGLDKPVVIQFLTYVKNMLTGDFGVSYNISKNTPISELIATRLPISMEIGFFAVFLGAIVGLILGVIAAIWHNTIIDNICTIISVIGVSVPSYVFALFLSYQFGFKAKIFPMLFDSKMIMKSSVSWACLPARILAENSSMPAWVCSTSVPNRLFFLSPVLSSMMIADTPMRSRVRTL